MNLCQMPFALSGLEITQIDETEALIIIYAHSNRTVYCPKCQQVSNHLHSHYQRIIKDVPMGNKAVVWQINCRRFRCRMKECSQQTFAEQHPELIPRWGRCWNRLQDSLTKVGLALGGQAGARLANQLHMPVSGSTLLRLVRQVKPTVTPVPRLVGIDDWAICKGKKYGTVVVDLETHSPLDLLPSRERDVVKEWLVAHPTIKVVTRDRFGEYREAIQQANPHIIQIVDRWHLVQNVYEMLLRYISSRSEALRCLTPLATEDIQPSPLVNQRRYYPGSGRVTRQEQRLQEREAKFQAVKARHTEGVYITHIAQEFCLTPKTIRQWLSQDSLPPDARGRFKAVCCIDPYALYLRKRLAEGHTNQTQLWREICKQGFIGDRSLVSRWIRQQGCSARQYATSIDRVPLPHPQAVARLLLRSEQTYSASEKQLWEWLQQDEALCEIHGLVRQFLTMAQRLEPQNWSVWLNTCLISPIKELRNLAINFQQDAQAIEQALTHSWSNGPVEGQVNRLKNLKRQMYGRANLDLLKIRFLMT